MKLLALTLIFTSFILSGFAQTEETGENFIPQNPSSMYMHKNHEIGFNAGMCFIDLADKTGIHTRFNYAYWFGKHFNLSAEYSNSYGSSPHPFKGEKNTAPFTFIANDHPDPITGSTVHALYSSGISYFPSHQDRVNYYSLNIKAHASINLGPHYLSIGTGPSLAYVDASLYGTFYWVKLQKKGFITEEYELNLAVPLYHRMLDFGVANQLTYKYILSQKVALNLNLDVIFYNDAASIFGATTGVSFKL